MGGTSKFVLFVLALPFALYGAWQVRGVSRADLIVADPPADRAASKEQLAATRAKTERWVGDMRKAAAVTYQFRAPGPDDATPDADCAALVRDAARRSADLTDLETFLAGTESPTYSGTLREKYFDWQSSRTALSHAEKAIEEWFTVPLPAIDSAAAAAKTLSGFNLLVSEYAKDARFSDPSKVAAWKLRARIELMKALEAAAESPYARALDLPLPLPPEADNADVRKALGAPRALREQVRLLQAEVALIDDSRLPVPARMLAEVKAALKRADEWAARERLLALFAEPTLFSDAAGAADWLGKVNVQFDRTGSTDERVLLRRKVQEFCEAFVPSAVLLDDAVLLDGKRIARSQVDVKYFPTNGKGSMRAKLTADPDRKALNEFTVAEKYPGESTLVLLGATEHYPKQLKPTEQSQAAVLYLEARREVGSGAGTPRWTVKSIDELKNKCKRQSVEVNRLRVPNGKPEVPPEIWTRLESLSKGAAACRQLFEKGQ
jgi:hypothetical protein